MSECTQCGTPGDSAFCGNCGASRATEAATATAATSQANPGVANDPTQYAPATAASQRPYEGYQSAGFAPPPGRDEATYDTTGATAGATASTQSTGGGTPTLLVALTAVAATLVLALVAYMLLRPGKDDGAQSPGAPAVVSSAGTSSSSETGSSPSDSSSSSSTSSSTQEASTSSESGQSASSAPTQTPSTVTHTETAHSDDRGFSAIAVGADGVTNTTSVGGTSYQAARQGNTVTVYEGSSDGAKYSVGILGTPGELSLVSLPNCSHPILLHNAKSPSTSAAYGWDGSGYQAFKSDGTDLQPVAGNGTGATAHGVNEYNGGIEYRDTPTVHRGDGNHFYQCTGSGSSDVLDFAGKGN